VPTIARNIAKVIKDGDIGANDEAKQKIE